ncbi:G-protein coupled receptor family C group 6 member A [Hemicordylus capensis]|uniref:G-protein coupled receptor family C group 6 member A n=1 Tax=Hemicordylus capensis TaxID=884348 RepID=UPI0023038E61|nr:G-protein coupled receptor family C group 6 member A [Hemicordylus capensis]
MATFGLLMPVLLVCFNIGQSCWSPEDFVGASSPGDIVIGGLFAIHGKMLHSEEEPLKPVIANCAGFEVQVFLQSLAMVHAIELINNSPLLPGIKLGYEIYDTCAEVTRAMAAALRFLSKFNASKDLVEFRCNYSDYIPRVKAVIGATYSEVSMSVARILNLQLIPQVSHASTAEILSDKVRFPSFLRTVPSDSYQTKAMAQLIHRSGWNWIGIIATDDDFGRLAVESFGLQAMANNVCIAFKEMLPAYLSDTTIHGKINQALEKIVKETRVNVIVVFLRQFHVMRLFRKAIERNINKTWIASDNWSAAVKISTIPNISRLGKVVGFTFKSGNMSSFHEFLSNLHSTPTGNNTFSREYTMLMSTCSHINNQDLSKCISNYSIEKLVQEHRRSSNQLWREEFLIANIEPGFIHSTMLAVYAIANAIRNQCKDRNCKDPYAFAPWELLEELKGIRFTDNEREVYFDSQGDINTGYDVLLWKEIDGRMVITNMAEYDLEKDDFIFADEEDEIEFMNLKNVPSKCSRKCSPGQVKKVSASPHTCCYECISCPENYYTNRSDMDYCILCNNRTHWSPVSSSTCYKKMVQYLNWNDWFAILLLVLSVLGVVLICAIIIIFTRNVDTPVVKASGGLTVCYVILLCHFLTFISTVFFIGKPKAYKCKTRQALFGISFALCISCILIKSLKILLAFSFDPKLQKILKGLYKPIPTVSLCTGIQVLICAIWITVRSPFVEENFSIRRVIILECNEGSPVALGIMLGYISLLAFICFICAFKGRKLPENYNEAKFITFGMLIYFIAWIIFIPVYMTTFGKYLPAVEIIVILISNYGILCCMFFPKCYIILYKQEANTKSAFLKMLYNYSSKSAGSLSMNQSSLDSKSATPPVPSTNDCCKSKSGENWVNGSCHFQSSGYREMRQDVPPKNITGPTIPRRRLSSI